MGRLIRRPAPAAPVAAADALHRVAVLLEAGVAPAQAWAHLAATGDAAAERVTAAVEKGMPIAAAISSVAGQPPESDGWRAAGAAWHVASTVGAPLAGSLRGLAGALRDAQEAADEVRIALAEPSGTARLMGWLPLVGVGLGATLGFDTLGSLVGHPLGLACLVGGGLLIVAARWWTTVLVRKARDGSGVHGHTSELLAIAVSGGASIDRARALVADIGAVADPSADGILRLSREAGVPAAELLRAAAELDRHRARVEGRLRAARLSSRLLLPLGVCTLPAFLLLGVAPMVLSVVSTMTVSW